ncbi:hypothetical protein LAZ67_1002007 [Cordylochernes scorpioides]|uniref:Uncharacterized protein n=1 Tax=Cordylochernes scorpioides TaxID=51811 RepID=A0ABY6JXH2_9ARAC|nr:hypothetical protein LAZ67_1002007 [Cordylochernes scorpioides]
MVGSDCLFKPTPHVYIYTYKVPELRLLVAFTGEFLQLLHRSWKRLDFIRGKLFHQIHHSSVVVVAVPNEELQMSPYISITSAEMSTWVCKTAALGPCQFYVVVVSNEEPQMSPYISITSAEMSTWVRKTAVLGPYQFSARLRPLLGMRICG